MIARRRLSPTLRVSASVLGALIALPSMAWGQAAPAPAPGGGSTTTSTPGGTSVPSTVNLYPGSVSPPPPGTAIGGGNITGSSSRPITGPNDRDGFDFKAGGGGQGSYRGTGSPVMSVGEVSGNVAGSVLVKKGDTLWNICDTHFHNPYQWPRIWSFNPQIQNPHWIYPGDTIRLRSGGELAGESALANGAAPGNRGIMGRRKVGPGTLFLRNQGYLDDADNQVWGEITGSKEDKMILLDHDEIYMKFAKDREVKLGQELTIFRQLNHIGGDHKIVEVQGTVRIDFYNPQERVARGRIVEAVDSIERGARIGPVVRKIEIVPPKRNEKEVSASVLASMDPTTLYGSNQIVFLNKGEKDGLLPGNRLFVIRRGDAWHDSLTTSTAAMRIPIEKDEVDTVESIPKPRDTSSLPEEVTAEIRVITVREHSAMALVTASAREIEKGEVAIARRGY